MATCTWYGMVLSYDAFLGTVQHYTGVRSCSLLPVHQPCVENAADDFDGTHGWHHACGMRCAGRDDGGAAAATVRAPAPVKALGGIRIVCVAAGLAHTAACCDAGGAYAWGWNADGQLVRCLLTF